MKVTRQELVERLDGIRGARMVTIFAETPLADKMRKKLDGRPNPYLAAVRRVNLNGVINWHYGNAVDRQREREGQPTNAEGYVLRFEPLPRSWGERLRREDGTLRPWVEHKGQFYLEVKPERYLHDEFVLDGKPLDAEDVKPWFYDRDEGKRQEVERVVRCRDYRIDRILSVTIGGEYLELV